MVSSFEEVPARDRVIVALDCGIEEATSSSTTFRTRWKAPRTPRPAAEPIC